MVVGGGSGYSLCLKFSSWNLLEGFPQCNFEDRIHPFCDWSHVIGDVGHWNWGSKSVPTPISGPPREFPYGGEETEEPPRGYGSLHLHPARDLVVS